MSSSPEREPLLHNHGGDRYYDDSVINSSNDDSGEIPEERSQDDDVVFIKVYKRRWYILLVYGLMTATQCLVWNTFGPITSVSERVFGWNDGDISLLTNWGPISYVIGTFAFSWIIDKKGLRPACVLTAFLIAAGTGLRCITSNTRVATPLIHIGQFLNGLAGPVSMGAPPAISAEWFAPEQRTTATAIASLSNALGCAIGFLLVPFLVPEQTLPSNHSTPGNVSVLHLTDTKDVLSIQQYWTDIENNTIIAYDVAAERDSMMRMMYFEFGFAVLCFLLFFTYFPSKPPLPPSPTASIQRVEYKTGLKQLLRNRSFWSICLTYGLSIGVLNAFDGVLDLNLKDHDVSQVEAGYIGFYGSIASIVVSLIVARFADIFSRHMKWFLLALFLFGGGCFIVLTFSLTGIILDMKGLIFAFYILGNVFMNAATPIFFETACEVTYPVSEGVTNLVLTLVNNMFGLIFLLIQMIPNIGTVWENWALLGAIFVCIPVLCLMKESYNRLSVDESCQSRTLDVNIDERQSD